MLHTYNHIARSYQLWIEKVDVHQALTEQQFWEMSVADKVQLMEQCFGPDDVLAIDKLITSGGQQYITYSGETTSVVDWEQLENINPDMFQTYTSHDGEKRALIVE